jgi:hypothetical protein
MKRLAQAFLLAALVIFAAPACSPFTACVKPYTNQLSWTGTITELGDVVGAFLLCDPTFNGGEAPVCALESLNQLETTLGPDGKAIIDCIVAFYEGNGTPKQQAAAKAVGIKRGVNRSACSGLPPLAVIGPVLYYEEGYVVRTSTPTSPCEGSNCVVSTSAPPTAMECDRSCGAPMSGLVTPSGCSCQRRVDGKLRWVPLAVASR